MVIGVGSMGRRYRILLVDDEERVLRALNAIFRRQSNYDVFLCTGPEEALSLLSRYPIDIIISDQRMPGFNGDELLELVKQQYPGIIRLLLTGSFDKNRLQAAIRNGDIFGYIGKPWNIEALNQLVSEAARAVDQPRQEPSKTLTKNSLSSSKQNSPAIQRGLQLSDITKKKQKLQSQSSSHQQLQAPEQHRHMVNSTGTKGLSLVLLDKNQRVRESVRKVSAHLKITVYVVNSFEQTVRILALRPDIGLVMLGIAEESVKTDVALRVLKRYRNDLTVIALANTSNISQAVNLMNNGRIFRYIHRLADLKAYHKAIFYAAKYCLALQEELQLNEQPLALEGRRKTQQALISKTSKSVQAKHRGSKPVISSQRGRLGVNEKTSIVLIEKDQSVRNSVRSISRELGFNIYGVNSYSQARATLKIRPDVGVVLVGISDQPKAVMREITSIKEQYKNIAVIALSEVTNQKAVIKMLESGLIFRYLQKPLDIFAYERAMQAAIKHSQMQERMNHLKQQQSLSLIKQSA
jgi:DNA-binding NtrC family response regulator